MKHLQQQKSSSIIRKNGYPFSHYISFEYKTFELIGEVTSEQGIAITDTYVQIWDKGEVIAQTKTDNLGQYTLPLPKIGTFTVMAGNRNKYFQNSFLE